MASTQLESSYVARTTRLVKPRSELFVFDRGGPAQVPCGDILAGVQDIGCRYIGPFPRRHDGQVNCRRLSCEAAMSGAEGSEQGHSLASLYWLSYFQSCCLIGSPGGEGNVRSCGGFFGTASLAVAAFWIAASVFVCTSSSFLMDCWLVVACAPCCAFGGADSFAASTGGSFAPGALRKLPPALFWRFSSVG